MLMLMLMLGVRPLENNLVTVPEWPLPSFVTVNFVSSFFQPDGEAKFWLTPNVALASQTGLSATQIRQAQAVVNAHLKEIQDAWNNHFGG